MIRLDYILLTTASLIAAIGYIPLFPYLDPAVRIVFPVALLTGAVAARQDRVLLKARPATAISISLFLFYLFQARSGEIVNPAVNLLVALLSVRITGERSPRNHLQIYALSLFALAASSLFDLDPRFLLYMGLQLLIICLSLVFLTISSEGVEGVSGDDVRRLLARSAIMPAVAFPLMILFFGILPRTQYPLWNALNFSGARMTGLTEEVKPGASSSVSPGKRTAFRAAGPRLPAQQLYWRAIVLNTEKDGVWRRDTPPQGDKERITGGQSGRFTIFSDPTPFPYLVTPDTPLSVSGVRSSQSSDFVFSVTPEGKRLRYEVSALSGATIATRSASEPFYTAVSHHDERFRNLASRIASSSGGGEEVIARLEEEFLALKLRYSTTGLPVGEGAAAKFLFQDRVGHCELFASSAATILRLAGVPARLVGGYLGGEYNDLGGYYLVTEDMAHVWVEAFVIGKGWIRIDPSKWSGNFGDFRRQEEHDVFHRASLVIDSLSYFWNQAVITYDLDKQMKLLEAAGSRAASLRAPSLKDSSRYLLATAVAASIVVGGVLIMLRLQEPREQRLLNQYRRKISSMYGEEAAGDRAGLIESARKTSDVAAVDFANRYSSIIFHDRRVTADEERELRSLIKEIGKGASGGVKP